MKIVAMSGSLRAESYNLKLLRAACELAPIHVSWHWGQFGDLPLYNEELDGEQKPAAVQELKDLVQSADALVIATPEYNYGVPGGLKNAIDWLSRPAYNSVLAHKPTLLMSASLSPHGAVRAQAQLKQILGGTLTPVFPAPEIAVGRASQFFDATRLTDDATAQRLERTLSDFCRWAQTYSQAHSA